MKTLFLFFGIMLSTLNCWGWGFYAHQRINRLAVFMLPPEMSRFYKKHLPYLMETATNPDKRRYAVVGEAAKHYLDVEAYGDSLWKKVYWKDALAFFGEDTLQKHGTVVWHIQAMKYQLTEAFRLRDKRRILKLSAEIGHYIADANVPLHTTKNYNGQLTGQEGIHAFWETRLPLLYAERYDFFVGPAEYQRWPAQRTWQAVREAHACLDTLFTVEKNITQELGEARKYALEEANGLIQKMYSRDFSDQFHLRTNRQVERQMRASVKMLGDFWLTAWIDAGQPDLNNLPEIPLTDSDKVEEETERKSWWQRLFRVREED